MKTSIKVAASRYVAESDGDTIRLTLENGRRFNVPGGHGAVLKSEAGVFLRTPKGVWHLSSAGVEKARLVPIDARIMGSVI